MVMESVSSFTTCVRRTSTVAAVQLPGISPSASPPYVAVSQERAPCEDVGQAGQMQGAIVALAERAHTAFQTPPVAADPESGPVGTIGLESQSTPVEDIAIQVWSLELQETGGPAHSASLEVNNIDNPALFWISFSPPRHLPRSSPLFGAGERVWAGLCQLSRSERVIARLPNARWCRYLSAPLPASSVSLSSLVLEERLEMKP
jgi:hypothetical protein